MIFNFHWSLQSHKLLLLHWELVIHITWALNWTDVGDGYFFILILHPALVIYLWMAQHFMLLRFWLSWGAFRCLQAPLGIFESSWGSSAFMRNICVKKQVHNLILVNFWISLQISKLTPAGQKRKRKVSWCLMLPLILFWSSSVVPIRISHPVLNW